MLFSRKQVASIFLPLLLFAFFWKTSTSLSKEADNIIHGCQAKTYHDETYTVETAVFDTYRKIYLKVYCQSLNSGSYTISSTWVDSSGNKDRTTSHSFTLKSKQDYSTYFWLKLNAKGTLRQIVTGSEFEVEQTGEWKVLTYLNELKIGENSFIVTN